MAINSGSHYRLGTELSPVQILTRSSSRNYFSRSHSIGTSLRESLFNSKAYDLLLSKKARSDIALTSYKRSQKSETNKLLEQIAKNNFGKSKAEEIGIKGKSLEYLKETLPDSYLLDSPYKPVARAKVAQELEDLYKRLDVGLSKLGVTASDVSGLRISTNNLPKWLKFDAASGTFFGHPPKDFSGEVNVRIRATLPNGKYAQDTITLNFVKPNPNNRAPYLTQNLQYLVDEDTKKPIGSATTGVSYRFTLSGRIFNDDDLGDKVEVTARVKGDGQVRDRKQRDDTTIADRGSGWPSWLNYHKELRMFEGTPPHSEAGKEYTFVVTGTDTSGASISSEFTLKVEGGGEIKAENVGAIGFFKTKNDAPFSFKKKYSEVFKSLSGVRNVRASLDKGKWPSWLKFSLDTIDPPKIDKKIAPQAMFSGTNYQYAVDLDKLLDDKGQDRYKVNAKISVGGGTPTSLPSWLEFDDKTNSFRVKDTAKPPLGDYVIHLDIDDLDDGYSVSTSFDFRVNAAGKSFFEPQAKKTIPDVIFSRDQLPLQVLADGSTLNPNEIIIPSDMFGEAPPRTKGFEYSLSLRDGGTLPSWLKLDLTKDPKIVKSAVPIADMGKTFALTLTAKHPITGKSATYDFSVEIQSDDIEVLRIPEPKSLYVGKEDDAVSVPDGTFRYVNPEKLKFSATLLGGAPLPSWLVFDERSQSFRLDQKIIDAMPTKPNGGYQVTIKASDTSSGKNAEVSMSITVGKISEISDKPQAISGDVSVRMGVGKGKQEFFLGENLFSKLKDGETYTYQLHQRDGSPLPSWVSFDATTNTIIGNPPAGTPDNELELVLFAKDPRGEAARVDVKLSVMNREHETYLKIYGQPSGSHPRIYDVVFEAGQGKDSAKSKMSLGVYADGGKPTPVKLLSSLPDISVDQYDKLNKKYQIDKYFDSVLSNSKYTIRQKDGSPIPSWLSFHVTKDQAPIIKSTLPKVALVKGEGLKFKQTLDPLLLVSDEAGDEIEVRVEMAGGATLPPWLKFNTKDNTLEIVDKDAASVGLHKLKVILHDKTDGHSVSLEQQIHIHPEGTVITPPKSPKSIGTRHKIALKVGEEVDLKSSSLFGSPVSGDSFSYELTMLDGTSIPKWLTFDPSSDGKIKVTGTPPTSSSKEFNFVLSATNSQGAEKRHIFSLTAFKEGHFFSQDKASVAYYTDQSDQSFYLGRLIHKTSLPKKLQYMEWQVNMKGGGALPSWLSFDKDSASLKVDKTKTPSVGVHEVEVTLKDPDTGLSKTMTVNINMHDPADRKDAPSILYGIPSRSMRLGVPFDWKLPDDMFKDPPVGETYTYEVSLGNGDPLPSWASFDPVAMKIVGTPPTSLDLKENMIIRVMARDTRGAETTITSRVNFINRDEKPHFVFTGTPKSQDDVKSLELELSLMSVYGDTVKSNFKINVNDINKPPKINQVIHDRSLSLGEKLEIDLTKHFSDPEDTLPDEKDKLTYSVTKQDGSAAPAWINVDAAGHLLKVDVPKGSSGKYDLTLKVKNALGAEISQNFTITVGNNHAPEFLHSLVAKSVTEGEREIIKFDLSRVSDDDGKIEKLNYKLEPIDDKAIADWVSIDNNKKTLTIAPSKGVSGVYSFYVVVEDEYGAKDRQEVIVNVSRLSEPSLEFSSGSVNIASGKSFSLRIPPYVFSTPDGERASYSISESPQMTSYDVEAFRKMSDLIWDEILQNTKYKEDFETINEENAMRIVGYLKAMDFLAGGDGSVKDFRYIKKQLPYLDRSLLDQELYSLRETLPIDRVRLTKDQALSLVSLALLKSELLESNVKDKEKLLKDANKLQQDIDKLLGIDMERILEERKLDYTSIGDSTSRAREAMKVLAEHILEPALNGSVLPDGTTVDLGLRPHQKQQANAVFRMLIRNMSFGSDAATIDKVSENDKMMIAGLMSSLDYLIGGSGKEPVFKHILSFLPKENAQYGEKYIEELSKMFSVSEVEVKGDPDQMFKVVARLSAEYDAYLSLPEKIQSLHKSRMNELQFQLENIFGIRNSIASRSLFAKGGLNYAVLFSNSVTNPASLLSASISSGDGDLLTRSFINRLYGVDASKAFSPSANSSALKLL